MAARAAVVLGALLLALASATSNAEAQSRGRLAAPRSITRAGNARAARATIRNRHLVARQATDASPALQTSRTPSLRDVRVRTQDEPGTPGIVFVFAGSPSDARTAIRQAWRRVVANDPGVLRREDPNNAGAVTYVVPMGRDVGYVGGARGASLGNPRADRVELRVVDGAIVSASPALDRAIDAPAPSRQERALRDQLRATFD